MAPDATQPAGPMARDSVCGGDRPSTENAARRREGAAASTAPERRPATPAAARRAGDGALQRFVRSPDVCVLAQTADLAVLADFPFAGTLLDPRAVRVHAAKPDVFYHAWVAVKLAIERFPNEVTGSLAGRAMEIFLAELGTAMMDAVEGPHYTFVDARLSNDTKAMAEQARRLRQLFREKDEGRRVIIGIPATFEGLGAAEELRKHDPPVEVNLLHVTNFAHARLCAAIGASAITLDCQEMRAVCQEYTSASEHLLNPRTGQRYVSSDWLAEIEATTEFLRAQACETRLVCADLWHCQGAVTLPAGTDCVALGDSHIETAREYLQPFVGTPRRDGLVTGAHGAALQRRYVDKSTWDAACDNEYSKALIRACAARDGEAMAALEEILALELAYQLDLVNMQLPEFLEKYAMPEVRSSHALQSTALPSVGAIDGNTLDVGASQSKETAANHRANSLKQEGCPFEEAAAAAEKAADGRKRGGIVETKQPPKRPRALEEAARSANKRKKQRTEVYIDQPSNQGGNATAMLEPRKERNKKTRRGAELTTNSRGRRPLTPKRPSQ